MDASSGHDQSQRPFVAALALALAGRAERACVFAIRPVSELVSSPPEETNTWFGSRITAVNNRRAAT